MAKLIRSHEMIPSPSDACAPGSNERSGAESLPAAAIYEIRPEICGNVDFVLFLSGNSTYRVDVVQFED